MADTNTNTNTNQDPISKVEMLIRKPVQDVFEAFVNPEITTKFWFTKGSGKLAAGEQVQWDWDMYGASAVIKVHDVEKNKRIVIDFGYKVEWVFTPQSANESFVTITSSEFTGDGIVNQAIGATEGFTIVLCGLKAYLEHGIQLNLVLDKAPYAHVKA
jgi:uncharacterized protein YndB with AHSA1/START domain